MSSPAKNQPHTPTLNSLLRQPAISTPGNSNAVIGSGPVASPSLGPSAGTNATGGSVPGPGYSGPYSPGPVATVSEASAQQLGSQQLQATSEAYYNNRLAVKGSMAPGNNCIPDGIHGVRYNYPPPGSPFQQPPIPPHHQQPPPPHAYYGGPDKMYPSVSGYPQPGVANGPSPNSPRTAAPAAQLHGQNKQNSTTTNPAAPREHDSMVNGIPPLGKGANLLTGSGSSQGDPSTSGGPKHPSVTALRQEANTAAGTRSAPSPSPVGLAAPSSPASLMRHSPVSPTPVSVYNQAGAYHGQPTPTGHFVPPQPQLQQPPPQPGFYGDGNYHYATYGHAAPGVNQGAPVYSSYTGSSNFANGPVAGPSNMAQPYYGHQPYSGPTGSASMPPGPNTQSAQFGGPVPTSEMMPAHQNSYGYGQPLKNPELPRSIESRATNGPTSAYLPGMPEGSRISASPAVADSAEGKDPSRNGSGTPNVDMKHRTSTPATPAGKLRVNGAKESHPSTPVPASPGGASIEDVDSSLSSPSWPRTPMSPALRNQPPSMGPPAPILSGGSGAGGSSKDAGANLVARLLGDPAQCSPQEWNERKSFYERLVMYCESNGHPITAQPTVSKQTVDLYRLYIAVRQKGGFEEVTKKKLWKDLCTMFGISQSNSASGQLKKQYSRFLFPFECYFDMHGIDPQPILASLESKKKTKAKAAAAAAAAAAANAGQGMPQQQQSRQIQSFPQPPPQQQPRQQQHYPNETFMGPPAAPYPGPADSAAMSAPGQPLTPANSGYPGQYPPAGAPYMQQRGMVPPHPTVGQHQPSGPPNEIGDERGTPSSTHSGMPYYHHPPGGVQPIPAASPSASTSYGQQKAAAYPGAYPNQNAMPAPPDGRMHPVPAASDGQPQTAYASPSSAPVSQQPSAPPASQSGYVTQMASPNATGYQSAYSNDGTNAPPPPNQYLTPQGPRYHGPVSSAASTEPASTPGMISHPYRSNVPTASSYGPGIYSGPPQSSYMPQAQQGESASQNQMAGHGGYAAPSSGDGYNTQAAQYPWTNQRYPSSAQQMGAQRFPPGANYPQSTMSQQNVDYSRMTRAGQPFRPNAAAYPSGPPPATPYANVPPNMSLRPDLGMKSLPTGASQYPQPSMVQTTMVKKELSPVSAFPPGSVEATTFTLKRRRKLMAKDAGSVEAWRLVMALRCGLQAETTWALNSLNILLYDDSSVMYFGLASLPGILETLVDHWRRSLMDILGDLFIIDEVKSVKARLSGSSVGATTSDHQSTCSAKEHEIRNCVLKNNCDNGKTIGDEADLFESNCNSDMTDLVISYESGLWHRGGGASTDHLKFRTDESCDEYYLNYGRTRRCSNSEKGQCWSKRKRHNCCEDTAASKRQRLGSVSVSNETTADSAQFFYSSRRYDESDEIESHNNLPLQVVPMTGRQRMDRCLSISNIVRGLSFIPGNEAPMSKHAGLLRVLAELLLMCHKHTNRGPGSLMKTCADHSDEDGNETKWDGGEDSSKPESQQFEVDMEDPLWYWDNLLTVVDDAFVILCNLSTHLDLYEQSEDVSRPLLDALLHWAVCRSPMANDPLVAGAHVSPHRYAVEILCKLSVQERNVDLLLATPPWERIEYLLEQLSTMLMLGEDIMMREFAVVIVHALCNANPVACAAAALKTKALQHMIIFLEQADASMHQVVQAHGMQALRDNPELIGTSVGMLRRAASTLLYMAKLPACHPKFNRFQQRLLHFTMSHLMDSRVAATVAEALYELQKADVPLTTTSATKSGGDTRGTKTLSPVSEPLETPSKAEAEVGTESREPEAPADEGVKTAEEPKVQDSAKEESAPSATETTPPADSNAEAPAAIEANPESA